jgi:hypothetical protein
LTFTIQVSAAANNAPAFAADSTTRSIAENTAADTNIGTAVTATDADTGDTLTYTLGGTDASSFSIVSTSGQLQTKAALDYETKTSYSVTVSVSDGNSGSDSITVTINVSNVNEAPAFASGASISNISATKDTAITSVTLPQATDPDANTTLTYTLTPALPAGLTFTASTRALAGTPTATKASTTYTYKASDGTLSNTLTFTIQVSAAANNAPVFSDGTSTTRSIAENTAAGTNIGTAVGATDTDTGDTLTYTLGGTDEASFSIASTTGQLQTKAALDYETKTSYAVTVSVSDGNSGSDSIDVTINITNVNEAPAFASGASISNISATKDTAITSVTLPQATDPDANTTLTYTLTPALPAGLTFTASTRALAGTPTATKASTTYTYKASDGTLSSTLTFTIQVSAPANNAPAFAADSTTRSIAENTASGTNIGTAVTATDADTGDTLTYTLGGTDASSFSIVSTSGQLQTKAALDYETKTSYSVTVSVSDGNGGSDSIDVTINVTDVDETNPSDAITFKYKDSEARRIGTSNSFRITITGTITASRSVRVVGTVEGYVNDDSIGIAIVNESIDAGKSVDVSVSGIWNHDGSNSQTVSIELDVTTITGLAAPSAQLVPSKTALMPNFPNPFNPETWIPYDLSEPGEVTLTIYNVRGVVVRELKLGHKPAGIYQSRSRAIHWDGRNMFGEKVATGVYFYTLTAGDFTATRKMLIRK